MLIVKDLRVSFNNREVVKGLSFTLSSKKILALIGKSGSGKSITALAIASLLKDAKISGEVILDEKNLLNLSQKDLCKIRGKDIGFVFQDPNTSLNPLHKIGNQIAEAITIHNPRISKKDLDKRVKELLDTVELESLINRLDSYPHQLSGGQKQRVMIAIALANNPKIIIADEPTTALDVAIQSEIINLILRLKNELGLAVLFITHNRNIVKRIADEIIEMKDGKIVKIDKKNIQSNTLTTHHLPLTTNKEVITVKNLSVIHQTKKSFFKRENFYANRGINFSLNLGENLGIIGESGSGKSTLALALCNLIKSQGDISFFNDKNWQKDSFSLRKNVQIIFQDPFSSLNPRMMIKDIIEEGLIIHDIKNLQAVDEIMQNLQLPLNLKTRYPHQLSGGQRQRVAIARALIIKPQILILDEPTSALDYETQNEILKLLHEIQQKQKISYITISHDLEVVAQISHKIMVLKSGEVVEMASRDELIKHPKNSYTKLLLCNSDIDI